MIITKTFTGETAAEVVTALRNFVATEFELVKDEASETLWLNGNKRAGLRISAVTYNSHLYASLATVRNGVDVDYFMGGPGGTGSNSYNISINMGGTTASEFVIHLHYAKSKHGVMFGTSGYSQGSNSTAVYYGIVNTTDVKTGEKYRAITHCASSSVGVGGSLDTSNWTLVCDKPTSKINTVSVSFVRAHNSITQLVRCFHPYSELLADGLFHNFHYLNGEGGIITFEGSRYALTKAVNSSNNTAQFAMLLDD